jgi:hypothetical protein
LTQENLDAIPVLRQTYISTQGDAFAERNKYAMKRDFELQPPEFPISETHCKPPAAHPKAPKVERQKSSPAHRR